MSKTPYELRLELLRLANEILTTPVHVKRETLLREFQCSRETFAHESETGPRNPLPFPTMPDYPSTEDVLKEAEKLKAFVDQAS